MSNFFSRHTLLLMVKFVKICIYFSLAIFLYTNIIGAEGLANVFKIDNPTTEGINKVNLEIPKYVLLLTFWAVVLEVLSNFLEIPDTLRNGMKEKIENKRLPY